MAKHGQHQQQETSASDGPPSKSGGRQAVVELCEISTCGLVFWSRTRFEIGAEVQVRMKRTALPPQWQEEVVCCPWVMLKGLVVACPPQRKEDGSSGFAVSLLIEADADGPVHPAKVRSKMRWNRRPMRWLRRFGLN